MADGKLTREELLSRKMVGTHVTESPLTGDKKVWCHCPHPKYGFMKGNDAIAKVEIPTGSTIIRPRGNNMDYPNVPNNKLRADQMKVTCLSTIDGKQLGDDCECASLWTPIFKYKNGEMHYPNEFDRNVQKDCSNGLHFFIDIESAKSFNLW